MLDLHKLREITMPSVRREFEDGYIVVHHIKGDREAVEYLRRTSMIRLDRLCYWAKRDGKTEFSIGDRVYIMTWNRDGSYSIVAAEDQPAQNYLG